MTLKDRLHRALQTARPGQMPRSLVLDLTHEGHTKSSIYELLERALIERPQCDKFHRSEEEALLDVMDALTGWCYPDAQLLSDEAAAAEKPSS